MNRKTAAIGLVALLSAPLAYTLFSKLPDQPQEQPKFVKISKSSYRRLHPVNLNNLQFHRSHQTQSDLALSEDELQSAKEATLRNLKVRGGVFTHLTLDDLTLKESFEEDWYKLEPDKNYASRVVDAAQDSLDFLFEKLPVTFKRPDIEFIVPKNGSEISLKDVDGIRFYLLAGIYGTRVVHFSYSLKHNGTEVPMEEECFAPSPRGGWRLDSYANPPIMYGTDRSPITIAETPMLEVLHKIFQPTTMQHYGNELLTIPNTYWAQDKSLEKWVHREEVFVHGLGIILFEQYNAERNLGFSATEISKRNAEYDNPQEQRYNGTNKMAVFMRSIGIEKAIEVYKEDPEDLFEAAGIQ